ncbi:SDR family oxidoreductase [bacterium]|nr:SDR family oxidoreductase [bacterium]
MRLKDKVAVITGAGSGIGRTAALIFSREGARVAVVDNNAKKGEDTVSRIIENGGEAIFVQTDVSRSEEVEKLFKITVEKYSAVHILYNNAGIFLPNQDRMVTGIAEETWDLVLNVNLKGTFLCCKYGIPEIIKSEGGVVINTSSSAGVIGVPNCDAYTATKGAIISLTRSMAVEYGPKKVRVNCIVPTAIDTPMLNQSSKENLDFDEKKFFSTTPSGRYGTPEEVANMALFLASDEASYCTGGIFVVDGGITIT